MSHERPLPLLPAPRRLEPRPGEHPLNARGELRLGAGPVEIADPGGGRGPEAYRLEVERDRVVIAAAGEAGRFRARATLKQLLRASADRGAIPCLAIEDWPDFAVRGAMLDVSRDRVPTMDTLFDLVDRLAEWKLNQLQLYMEHTFAYPGHEAVWKDASPFTGDEIERLDAYCRERFIELVPNQNSFGHMERWLVHPRYAPLAEIPAPEASADEGGPPPTLSLCPVDPGSLALIAELYDALLPHFSSRKLNAGCDETLDLGKGRSRDACLERGPGRVYLDYLAGIHRLASERGRSVQFWGDIILKYPERIPELPSDVTVLDWGYEADHPFDDESRRFAAAGIPHYVCPGTSSWISIAGRTDNALGNLRAAARAGLAHGAAGYLVTDWGDYGHWQPHPVSWPPLAFGAAQAWCAETNAEAGLATALDLHLFRDDAGRVAGSLLGLGNAYRDVGALQKNASLLAILLLFPQRPLDGGKLSGLTVEGLALAAAGIEGHLASLAGHAMSRPDARLVEEEIRLAGALLLHACRVGIARIEAGRVAIDALPVSTRDSLAEDLRAHAAEFRRIWLERNRPGGLADSAGRMDRLGRAYLAG